MLQMSYSSLAWGNICNKIELLQKRAVIFINLKSPIAHTELLLKKMKLVKLFDLYICHLLKLYYKLYRNRLPACLITFCALIYFVYQQAPILAPTLEFGAMNAKYQMHLRLQELANPSNPLLYLLT